MFSGSKIDSRIQDRSRGREARQLHADRRPTQNDRLRVGRRHFGRKKFDSQKLCRRNQGISESWNSVVFRHWRWSTQRSKTSWPTTSIASVNFVNVLKYLLVFIKMLVFYAIFQFSLSFMQYFSFLWALCNISVYFELYAIFHFIIQWSDYKVWDLN